MASYLAEFLASEDEMQLVELSSTLTDINEKLSLLKIEVKNTFENEYIHFVPLANDNNRMLRNSKLLSSEIEELQECIAKQKEKNLKNSTEELKSLTEALAENTLCIKVVNRLLELDVVLTKAEEDKNAYRYLEAAKTLNLIDLELAEKNKDIESLDIYKGITSEVVLLRSRCIGDLIAKWEKCVNWSTSYIDKKQEKLVLKIDVENEDKRCIQALHSLDHLVLELKKFADKFYNDILCKIITKNCNVIIESDESLSVVSSNKLKTFSCINILDNLTVVLKYIDERLKVDLGNRETVITLLGKFISQDFLQFLIKHCLSKSVPRRIEELESYDIVIKEIVKFNDLLLKVDFIEEGNNCIMEYAVNIKTLSANKTCQSYMEAARNIMKKDLSNMIQVGSTDEKEDDLTNVILTELKKNFFQFPLCQVSTSTIELLDLIDEILNESSKNTGYLGVQLFYTARNIFKMYCHIVPEFHHKLLETIPQQSVLFHNNCMFLAHKLQTLNIDFRNKCSSDMMNSHMVTFIDLVKTFRFEAGKVLQNQLLTQRKHLTDILGDSGLVTLSDNPQFPQGVEKAVRQCLRQLALLQKVWQHVLPRNVYCKSVGLLCNTLIKEIFQKVISAKDIPEDTASQLVSVFVIIQQKGPLVFPEPKEIHYYVKGWNRFCELILLLKANLKQIDDRWADGKGPLALEFSPEQVRQMIQALFQISDKRSALLAKIK